MRRVVRRTLQVLCGLAALVLVWVGSFGGAMAQGTPPDDVEVPDALQPWTSWVLEDHPKLRCASSGEGPRCVWPGRLSLRVDDGGASFELRVWLSTRDTVLLPGGDELWPHELSTTGSELTLIEQNDRPAVELGPGTHRIRGRLEWDDRPGSLEVPSAAAEIDLEVDGEPVERPRRASSQGGVTSLYLEQGGGERPEESELDEQESDGEGEENSLQLRIHRKLADGIPLEVRTHVELVVGGESRTVDLGPLLLEGTRPVSYRLQGRNEPGPPSGSGRSTLVVREIDGRNVKVHASAGTHEMTVVSVFPAYPSSMAVPERARDFYPEREYWAWQPKPELHSVSLEGLRSIGPSQTTLPKRWHDDTTYVARPKETLELERTGRGTKPSPNELDLERTIFLRDGGEGYLIRDRISGTMKQNWRLDYGGPAELGRVTDVADDSLRLITEAPEGEGVGVEQRSTEVDLEAALTLDGSVSEGPFVGWNFEPESIETTLSLPEGWQFVYATGVDSTTSRTWIETWTLWNLFFVLLVAVVVGRATRWYWGALAVVVVAGCHTSVMAPWWLWLFVALGVAVASMERHDRLEGPFRVACLIVAASFCFHLAWFAVGQTMKVVHPRLADEADSVLEYEEAAGPVASLFRGLVGGVVQQQSQRAEKVAGERQKILKATSDIAPGEELSREDVTVDEVPEQFLPNNVVQKGEFQVYRGAELSEEVDEGKMLVADDFAGTHVRRKGKRKGAGGSGAAGLDLAEQGESANVGLGAGKQPSTPEADAQQRRATKKQMARRQGKEVEELDVERRRADAVEQTGPGLPDRVGQQVAFSWSKAVPSDHRVRFWLLPPWAMSLLYLLHLLAALVLAWVLLATGVRAFRGDEPGRLGTWVGHLRSLTERTGAIVLALGVASGATLVAPSSAAAQGSESGNFPPRQLLKELESRLTDAYECTGQCLQVPRASVEVDGNRLRATLEVHAQKPVAVPLPGTREAVQLDRVRIDGSRTTRMRGGAEGEVLVRVEEGYHDVSYAGSLPEGVGRHRLSFGFSGRGPRHLAFESDDWQLEQGSLRSNGRPREVVTLVGGSGGEPSATPSERESEQGPSFGEPERWFRVERRFTLGLPWKVETDVRRTYPRMTTVLNYPLLEGETPANPLWEVDDGNIALEFEEGRRAHSFASKLSTRETFELEAPADEPWVERWTIECTRVWHCSFSDLSSISSISEGRYRPTWAPHPGETLTVTATRPKPVEGRSTTIQNVAYRGHVGERLLEGMVDLTVRSSRGGKQSLTLPAEANLQELKVDGETRSNRELDEGQLTVDLPRGTSTVKVRWEQTWDPLFVDRLPKVKLGRPASNVETRMGYDGGLDPLILAVGGPDRGTVSLLWLHLLWIPFLAFLFGRFGSLPIRTWEWTLLGLGFVQVAATTFDFAAVFVCFLVFALREKFGDLESPWKFNLVQVALAVVALTAALALYRAGWTNFFAPDFDAYLASVGTVGGPLGWYVGSTEGTLPRPWVFAAPDWIWRVAGLLWAGWVVAKLPNWGSWLWRRFGAHGYFRKPESMTSDLETSEESGTDGTVESHDSSTESRSGEDDESTGSAEATSEEEGTSEAASDGEEDQSADSDGGEGESDEDASEPSDERDEDR